MTTRNNNGGYLGKQLNREGHLNIQNDKLSSGMIYI